MISPGRRVSYDLLCKVELDGLFSDDAANSPAVERLDTRDRHLTTELIKGTLRWQGFLDYLLAQACSRPWPKVDARLRILLRMSLYQMWRMDRIPDHALVNEAVALAKRQAGLGSAGFVNAILRKLCRERPWRQGGFMDSCPPWIRVSLPEWLWERWAARFGAGRSEEYALSLNEPAQTAFRLSSAREPAEIASDAGVVASELVPGAYLLAGATHDKWTVDRGVRRFQDEASQLIPFLLGTVSGWRIWDACAAPGGKSAILCEMCGETGLTVSSDISRSRLFRLADSRMDLSYGCCCRLILDARKRPPFRRPFDAVLADVPCSGLGTLRRNPEIRWRIEPEQLGSFRTTQMQILDAVSHAVRPGGLLLYSTCSTEPEENEDVITAFLARRTEFRLVRPSDPPGVQMLLDADGLMRTFPGVRRWDGFFAALMECSS